jgi:hypothetical protein
MKNYKTIPMKKQYNIVIALLFLPLIVFSNEIDPGKYSKQKTIKKAYVVNSDAGIDIKNSYGTVSVSTWDEDKIELDILIKVSGDNESWVDKRLEDIDVDIEALKNMVSAQTNIKSGSGNGKKSSIEINYTIKIPKKGSVKINNKYGSIVTADLFATVNLNCDYGKITTAKLTGATNTINIDYCSKSSIEYVKNATINADYSGLTINEFGKINLSADYTDLSLINGNELKYNCSYGKLRLGKISTLEGDGDYLSVYVDEIGNQLKITTAYGKVAIGEIDAKANSINISSEYTSVDMAYNAGAAFDFDINVKYANFHSDNLEISSKQESGTSKSYQGFYKKSGAGKIVVRSEYGNVSLSKK